MNIDFPASRHCNVTYPNEFACIPMNVGKNCSDSNPVYYYVHFTAPNLVDVAGKLHTCFNEYLETCKHSCSYCWNAVINDITLPRDTIDISYYLKSYVEPFRQWTVIISGYDRITLHTFYVLQGYANTIISHCEKVSQEVNYKLYYGLGICVVVLLGGVWVAYSKYRDYQYRHILDHMKPPTKSDTDVELSQIS